MEIPTECNSSQFNWVHFEYHFWVSLSGYEALLEQTSTKNQCKSNKDPPADVISTPKLVLENLQRIILELICIDYDSNLNKVALI